MFLDLKLNGASGKADWIEPKNLISIADLALRIKYDSVSRICEAVQEHGLQLVYCHKRSEENPLYMECYGLQMFYKYTKLYYLNLDKIFFRKHKICFLEEEYPKMCEEYPHSRTPDKRIVTEDNLLESLKEIVQELRISNCGNSSSGTGVANLLADLVLVLAAAIGNFLYVYVVWQGFFKIINNHYPYKTDHIEGYTPNISREDYLEPLSSEDQTFQTQEEFNPQAYVEAHPCKNNQQKQDLAYFLRTKGMELLDIASLVFNYDIINATKKEKNKYRTQACRYAKDGEKRKETNPHLLKKQEETVQCNNV